MPMTRVHITGAAGAGVTTFGAALAETLGLAHLDTDDFYWAPSDPPYDIKRPIPERLQQLERAFSAATAGWVLSGSLISWGEPLQHHFEHVVFVSTAQTVRLERLAARERARYGQAIAPGGRMHQKHLDFIAWAARYEDTDFHGRSRVGHEAWLAQLRCPVIRLDGARATALLVAEVIAAAGIDA